MITTIEQLRQAEEGQVHEITVLVKKIFRTEQGLNIFTVSDGNEEIRFVKFTKGDIAYGDIQEGSVATFKIKRRTYEEELQGTIIDASAALQGAESLRLRRQVLLKEYDKHAPADENLLVDTMDMGKLRDSLVEAATLIKGAIHDKRPIIITHHNDADGYAAGLLLERAIKEEVQAVQGDVRYIQNFILRNPSKTPYYNLTDVTKDIAYFQLNHERAGVASPLILITDNGSTEQDVLAIKKAALFGADAIVIDHHDPGEKDEHGNTAVCRHTLAHINPHLQGIRKDISASMLCFELAHFLRPEEPSALIAAIGGVADRCEGSTIEQLIKLSKRSREFLQTVGRCIDYEIYHTRYNHSTGPLYELFDGEQQQALIDLYAPIMAAEKQRVRQAAEHYSVVEEHGDFTVHLLDGEATTLWGDYWSIGKLAGVLHDAHDNLANHVTIIHSNNIIVFRCTQQDRGFDVNEILAEIEEHIVHARVDGGGHANAGSLRFIAAAKDEVLAHIKSYIAKK